MKQIQYILLEPRDTRKHDAYILLESPETGDWHAHPVETDGEICQVEELLKLRGFRDLVTFPIYKPGPDGVSPETGPNPYTMEKTGDFITLHPRKLLFLIPR